MRKEDKLRYIVEEIERVFAEGYTEIKFTADIAYFIRGELLNEIELIEEVRGFKKIDANTSSDGNVISVGRDAFRQDNPPPAS